MCYNNTQTPQVKSLGQKDSERGTNKTNYKNQCYKCCKFYPTHSRSLAQQDSEIGIPRTCYKSNSSVGIYDQ